MLGNTIIARKGDTDAANIPQFILDGFVPNPIPTPVSSASGILLYLGIPKLLFEGYDTDFVSDVFILPTKTTKISWQIFGNTITEVNLLASEDGVNFIQIDQAIATGLRTIFCNAPFVQVEVVDGLDVTVILMAKQGNKP